MKDYDGKLTHVYKHYPLPMHPWAMPAALATEAVYRLNPNLFWELHERLFSKQRDIKSPEDVNKEVEAFLTSKNANLEEYKKKLAAPETKQAVDNDMKEASSVGVQGTPAFFVDGHPYLRGALPAEEFRKAFDVALAARGVAPPPKKEPSKSEEKKEEKKDVKPEETKKPNP